MLVGIGTDLVNVPRIAKVFARFGDRFLKRAFSESEINVFKSRMAGNEQRGMEYLASRWALKEATYKILNGKTGIRIPFPDISSSTSPTGKIVLELTGRAKKCSNDLNITHFHVSVSHEVEYVSAFVVMEKE